MNNTIAVIQSRVGSRRLPEKALLSIAGVPLTEHVVRRTHRACPDPILALPNSKENDRLANLAGDWPCRIARGPEHDVLKRFIIAIKTVPEAKNIIRVTGDNPLISSSLMERLPDCLEQSDADYASWKFLSYGVGCGIYSRHSLMQADKHASDPMDREHVTLWIKNTTEFSGARCRPPEVYRAPGLRLTVDTREDLQLIRKIHETLPDPPFELPTKQAVQWISKNPKTLRLNRHVDQEIYTEPRRVLYVFNEGETWGLGHRVRYQRIYSQSNLSEHRIKIYGISGGSNQSKTHEGLLRRSRKTLYPSIIKRWVRRTGADVVIFDQKETSSELVNTLKQEEIRVIGIEDRGSGRENMDAIIDPNLYSDTLTDDRLSSQQAFYGPEFALIDPRFRRDRHENPPEEFYDFGIFFGGTDPGDLGIKFLQEIIRIELAGTFHYFGPASNQARIQSLDHSTPGNKTRIKFEGLVENPAKAFSNMDMMIIGGGVVKFEVACLQLPAILITQNQEQYENSRRFLEQQDLDWPLYSYDSSPETWIGWFEQPNFQQKTSEIASQTQGIVDGRAMERFYRIIDKLIGKF